MVNGSGPRIVIEMGPTGLQVSGPIQDKILCLGMMELAKSVILTQKEPGSLVVPVGAPPAMTRLPGGKS